MADKTWHVRASFVLRGPESNLEAERAALRLLPPGADVVSLHSGYDDVPARVAAGEQVVSPELYHFLEGGGLPDLGSALELLKDAPTLAYVWRRCGLPHGQYTAEEALKLDNRLEEELRNLINAYGAGAPVPPLLKLLPAPPDAQAENREGDQP